MTPTTDRKTTRNDGSKGFGKLNGSQRYAKDRIQSLYRSVVAFISDRRRLLMFPAAVVVVVMTFTAFGVSGSSSPLLATDAGSGDSVVFGLPRSIRSDEWIVHTPMVISQVENNLPRYGDVGVGSHDMSILSDLPVLDWTIVFHPNHWAYLILPIDNAYAFDWWSLAAILLLGTYCFLFLITGSLRWSIIGALFLYGSPYFHWWYTSSAFTSLGWMTFAVSCMLIAVTSSWRRRLVFAGLASYSLVCFALVIYPPWQIPGAIAVASVGCGALWTRWRTDSASLRSVLTTGVVMAVLTLVPLGVFVATRQPAMNAIAHTVYPGARVIAGGSLPWTHLFTGWFGLNYLTNGAGMRGALFPNESEASSFLFLGVMLLFALPLVWRFVAPLGDRLRAVMIATISVMMLFFTHIFVGLPKIVARMTLLSVVPEQRTLMGLGFASMVLVVVVGVSLERFEIPRLNRWFATAVLVVVSAVCVSGLAQDFRSVNAAAGSRLIAIAVIAAVASAALYFWRPLVSVGVLALFGLMVSVPVNPLVSGISQARDALVVTTVRTISSASNGDGAWVADTYPLASLLTTAGVRNLSGVNLYPNVAAWEIIDPSHTYENAWNRYSQAVWSFDTNLKAAEVALPQADMVEVKINPCDPVLDKFNLRHIVTETRVAAPCLRLQEESVGPYGVPVFFYQRTPVGTPSSEGWTVR